MAAPRVGTAYVAIQGDFAPLGKQLRARGGILARQSTKIGAAIGVGIAAGAVGAGVGAFKIGAAFDDAYDKIRVGTGATGKHLKALQGDFKAVVKDVPTDFASASSTVTDLSKRLGLTGKPLRRLSKQMLELSRITGTDVNENVAATSRLFGDWSVTTGKQAETLDRLFRLSQATGIGVGELSREMVAFGSPLRQLGFGFDEAAAMFAKFEKEGVNTSALMPGLKFALKNLSAPTDVLSAKFKRLGVDVKAGPASALQDVMGAIKKAPNDLKANAIAFDVFGQRAGPDMAAAIREGRFELGDLQRTMRRGKDTIRGAGRDTEDFAEKWQRFKNNVLIGLEPVATRVFGAIGDAMGEVTAIATDPKLTTQEKFSKLFARIRAVAESEWPKLQAFVEKVAPKVLDALSKAMAVVAPKVAEAIKAIAPKVAGAFVEGFLGAGAWGRLLIAGVLLKKMGGMKAFRAVGLTGGTAIAQGMAPGIAAGMAAGTGVGAAVGTGIARQTIAWSRGPGGAMLATVGTTMGTRAGQSMGPAVAAGVGSSGLKGRLAGLMRGWGPMLGITLGAALVPEIVKAADKVGRDYQAGRDKSKVKSIESAAGGDQRKEIALLDKRIAKLKEVDDAEDRYGHRNRKTRLALEARRAELQRTVGAEDKATAAQQKALGMSNRFAEAIRGLRLKGSKDFDKLVRSVTTGSRRIREVGGNNAKLTRVEISRQFAIARQRVKDAMDQKVISVKTGTERLRELAAKELKLYGISAGRVNVVLAQGASGEARPHQRGGHINVGAPTGDSVPAILERDEYVLNRKAVKKVGKSALDRLNFGTAPRFQQGGIVELLHPFNDPAGHGGDNSHLHVAAKTAQQIVAIGKRLQKMGWLVGEHPAFGGVNARHAPGGYHYTGQAIDANWPDPSVEGSKIRAVLSMLGEIAAGGGRTFDGLPRVALKGPASVALEAGQGALDRIRSAANASIERAIAPIEGAEAGVGMSGSGPVESVFANVAKRLSRSKVATQALGMAGYAESGMQDLPGGHSTSTGSLQLLASTAAGMGIDPHDEAAVASAFLQRGYYGKGGANTLAAQGLPAHLVAQGVQGSAFSDGSNYLAQAGRARAWMKRYGLQLGGLVGMQQGGVAPDELGDVKRQRTMLLLRALRLGRVQRAPGRPLNIGAALRRVRAGKTPKIRKDAIRGLVDRIKSVGLPTALQRNLGDYATDANTSGEFADRASQLTVEPGDGGDPIQGVVGGKTQTEWLNDQLAALFRWRNAIITAEKIIVERREQVAKLIEQARERLSKVSAQIVASAKTRKGLAGQLEKARKHPKRNKALITTLREKVGEIDGVQRVRERVRSGLKDKILPALTGKRTALGDARVPLLDQLDTVQGIGSPTRVMTTLPPMGELGGSIFDVQTRLRDLLAPREAITDTTPAAEESPIAEDFRQLLREANVRTAVSERQFDVLRNMPPFGGSFAIGGVVPGPVGAPRTIVAHGGETVVTADENPAGGTIVQHIHHVYLDGRQLDVKIDSRVDKYAYDAGRRGSRGAKPGRAGVMR